MTNTFSRCSRVRFTTGHMAGEVGTVKNRSRSVADVIVYSDEFKMHMTIYDVPIENLERVSDE